MKYVVFKSGGNQYKVNEDEEVLVDNLNIEEGKPVVFDEVLLFVEDENVKVGKPFIPGFTVEGKSLGMVKGEKIRVSKFKAKSRYDKTIGFRHQFTKVKIGKLGVKPTEEKPATKPKKASKKE